MAKTKAKKGVYATEDFVWKVVNRLEESMDNRFDEAETKSEKRHSQIMGHLDSLTKGFKKFDEEQTILSAHSKDHTERIEKIEKVVYAAS